MQHIKKMISDFCNLVKNPKISETSQHILKKALRHLDKRTILISLMYIFSGK